MSRVKKKPKKEFSKLILICAGAVTVLVTAFTFIMVWRTNDLSPLAYLIPAVFTELGVGTGFYYSKAKAENRIKLRKMYGPEIYNDTKEIRTMLEAIMNNLINIGWAMLIFLAAYLSNVAFSLYYNIKILLQPFDREKAINSALKVAAFVVGLTLLCVSITTLPLYANQVGWAIPEEYADMFADLVIIGAVLIVSCKYIVEAFTKFKAILEVTPKNEIGAKYPDEK